MTISKNIYLQVQIADLLRGKSSESALTITEITSLLKSRHNFQGTRKTVERNLHGMSNEFKLSSSGVKPAKYWIEDYFEPDLKIGLNPYQLQLITYALRNMAQVSTPTIKKALKETEATLFTHLPDITKKELQHSLRLYEENKKAKPAKSWPKNNFEKLLLCVRKNLHFKARLKLPNLSKKERHLMRTFTIKKIWFDRGEIYLKVFEVDRQKEFKVLGSNLNGVEIINTHSNSLPQLRK
jgi:hypothetical protein